jgi:hypothetical protein
MADRGAMLTSWGAARPGVAPAKAMEVFAKALGWYDELAKEGRISGYRVYSSTSRDAGLVIAEGTTEELAKLGTEEQATTLLALASAVVEDVRTELLIGGNPDDVVGFYVRAIDALAKFGLHP